MDTKTLRAEALAESARAPEPNAPRSKGFVEERAAALAKGLGYVRAGHTLDVAALECGIARSTLWDHYQRTFGADGTDAKDRRELGDRRIEAGAQGIAEFVLSSMGLDLEDDAKHPPKWVEDEHGHGQWKRRLDPRDKANYLGVAEKALNRIRREAPQQDPDQAGAGWGSLMERMQQAGGGKATITMSVESPEIVDVTPKEQ